MTDYSPVTETWGLPASPEQLSMQYCRYSTLRDLARGGSVLEVGCGTGMGLPLLSEAATLAVGGDYTQKLLNDAREHVSDARLVRMDAQHLPFADASFDVVAMLEMVYYIPDQAAAFNEARRVLRPGGRIFACMPNPDRPDFNPSPFATRYLNVPALADSLQSAGFTPTVMGGFPVEAQSGRDSALAPLRHLAVRYHLIPRSMRLKALVKRALYGRLPRMGDLRARPVDFPALVELDPSRPSSAFKNIYAVGVVA